jgi:hypothetical protein
VNTNKLKLNKLDELKKLLAKSGRSGLLAYGFLNCAYYTLATGIAWKFSLAKLRVAESITLFKRCEIVLSRLGSVLVMVWAGSQVTKVFRLSGAVALAPLADKMMTLVKDKLKLSDENAAFWFSIRLLWLTFAGVYLSFLLIGTTSSYIKVY